MKSPHRRHSANTTYITTAQSNEDVLWAEFSRRGDWQTGLTFIHSTEIRALIGHDYTQARDALVRCGKLCPENTVPRFNQTDQDGKPVKGTCLTYKLTQWLIPTSELKLLAPMRSLHRRSYSVVTQLPDVSGRCHWDVCNEIVTMMFTWIRSTTKNTSRFVNWDLLGELIASGKFYDWIANEADVSRDAVKEAVQRICHARFLSWGTRYSIGIGSTYTLLSDFDRQMKRAKDAIQIFFPDFYRRCRSAARRDPKVILNPDTNRFMNTPFVTWLLARFEQTITTQLLEKLPADLADEVNIWFKHDGGSVFEVASWSVIHAAYQSVINDLGFVLVVKTKWNNKNVVFGSLLNTPKDIWQVESYESFQASKKVESAWHEAYWGPDPWPNCPSFVTQ